MALLIAGKPGLEAYLNRIKFLGSTTAEPTLANLALLHKCHTMNIPFENLIFNHHKMKGTERPVDIDSLHSRIVQRRRGGMCQEMNTLLKHHLQQLGAFQPFRGVFEHTNGWGLTAGYIELQHEWYSE